MLNVRRNVGSEGIKTVWRIRRRNRLISIEIKRRENLAPRLEAGERRAGERTNLNERAE